MAAMVFRYRWIIDRQNAPITRDHQGCRPERVHYAEVLSCE